MVAHFRKIKTGAGLSAVAKHNQRLNVYDVDGRLLGEPPGYITRPDRAQLNALDRCGPGALHDRRSQRIEAAKLGRAPQKNAAYAIEGTFSASPRWFKDNPDPKHWNAYFDDLVKWNEERFGKENILHVAKHFDEKTPHMHIMYTPIIETTDGPRYTSSNFLGGRSGMRRIHTKLFEDVGKDYGLERGELGSRARHRDQYHWDEDLTAREEAVAAKELEQAERQRQIEAIAEMEIPPFKPEGKRKDIIDETRQYARKLEIMTKSAQAEMRKYKNWFEHASVLKPRLDEAEKVIKQYRDLTPDQHRQLANQKEAEIAKREQQRQIQRDKGHDHGMGW